MRISLDNHGGYVELLDSSLAALNPAKWVTDCAAIARGNHESNNPPKRYDALKKEAEGNQPSRPLEFLPIVTDVDELASFTDSSCSGDEVYRFLNYTYTNEDGEIFTNARAMINLGVYDPIPVSKEAIHQFAAFRAKIPMFSWAQVVTHTKLSTESQSDRVSKEDDYWLPSDIEEFLNDGKQYFKLSNAVESVCSFIDKTFKIGGETIVSAIRGYFSSRYPKTEEQFKDWMLNYASQAEVQEVLKNMGYKQEIYGRAPYYFKMKEFVITGWCNDDDAWPHFLRERSAFEKEGIKNWTQGITKVFAENIRVLLESENKIDPEVIIDEWNNKKAKREKMYAK